MPLYIHTFSLAVWYMRIVCPFGEANERVVAVCVCVCGRNEWLASKSGGCLALTKI